MFQKIFEYLGPRYNKVRDNLKEGKLVEAFEACKEFDEVEAKVLKGMILILLKKYNKAVEIFKSVEVEGLSMISKDIYFELLGLCYYEENNHLEAAQNFIKALEINNNNFYAKYNLSNIYLLKKDYKKAYEYLLDLEKVEPQNDTIKKNIELLEKFL